ncbi:hypothetical protein KAR91_21385 [Candidatus Pacearchaeota archaeon]|nr:hypothetical protein [Candidatus Pacearchaeota archaeon]
MPEETDSFILAGPVWTEFDKDTMDFAIHVGYGKKLFGVYIVGEAEFGNSAEFKGEVLKLFRLSGRLHGGVSAGVGVNYVKEEVPIEELLFGSGGIVGTFALSDRLGTWAFWESRTQEDPKVGFGLFLKI